MRKLTLKAFSSVILSAVICPAALAAEGDQSGYHYVRLAELVAKGQQKKRPFHAVLLADARNYCRLRWCDFSHQSSHRLWPTIAKALQECSLEKNEV